jgi:hypothetical protein
MLKTRHCSVQGMVCKLGNHVLGRQGCSCHYGRQDVVHCNEPGISWQVYQYACSMVSKLQSFVLGEGVCGRRGRVCFGRGGRGSRSVVSEGKGCRAAFLGYSSVGPVLTAVLRMYCCQQAAVHPQYSCQNRT